MRSLPHIPNHIPRGTRIRNLIFSSVLLIYGALGVYIDDLYIPGKRSRGIHLHGEPAWIMYAAFVCAAANLLAVVIDHYDTRPNERNYRTFALVTQIAGWSLFGLAIVFDLFVFRKATF